MSATGQPDSAQTNTGSPLVLKSTANPPPPASETTSAVPSPPLPAAQQFPPQDFDGPYAWAKLDPRFFTEEFDPMKNLWENLPKDAEPSWFTKTASVYDGSREKVDQRLQQKVMSSYDMFVAAMAKIQTLHMDLEEATNEAHMARTSLSGAKDYLAVSGLKIVALYRRRQQYRQIVEFMLKMKKLLKFRLDAEQAAVEGDFPKALGLCLGAKDLLKGFEKFNALSKMHALIQHEYLSLKKKLDNALYDCCRSRFLPAVYEKVLKAFFLIADAPRILEAHQRHFRNTIDAAAKQVVLTHVLMNPKNVTNAEALNRLKFWTLCKKLTEEHFVSCLHLIMEQFCEIMYSHYQIMKWMQANDIVVGNVRLYETVAKGLWSFKREMWEYGMQRRILMLLQALPVNNFQIDKFLSVLESLSRFMEIGEEFIGGPAHKLRDNFKERSNAYFESYHRARMEELRVMLENELWAPCPLPKNYSYRDVKELQHFTENIGINLPRFYTRRNLSFYIQYEATGNPFSPENLAKDALVIDPKANLKKVDPDGDIDPALLVQSVDEGSGKHKFIEAPLPKTPAVGPMISTTTISVLKFVGRYLDLMKTLEHISYEVFEGLTQIVDYYAFAVYYSFALSTQFNHTRINPALITNLKRIQTHLIFEPPAQPSSPYGLGALTGASHHPPQSPAAVLAGMAQNGGGGPSPQSFKIPKPKLPDQLRGNTNFLVVPTMVSAESLLFLQDTLNAIKPVLHGLLPKEKNRQLDDFYEYSIGTLPNLRELVYRGLGNRVVSAQKLIQVVSSVAWDTHDIRLENSAYVGAVVKEYAEWWNKLKQIAKAVPLSEESIRRIWDYLVLYALELIVEGWSRAKSCTPEGRAVMSLDLTVLQNGLENITKIRPTPHLKFAEDYVKAYYFPDDELQSWLNEHSDYYTKLQLIHLISRGPWKRDVKSACILFVEKKDY